MKARLRSLFRPVALLGALTVLVSAPFAQAQLGPVPGQLVNLSVRSKLDAGKTLVVGFTITGTAPARILIRGVGPSLTPFGVTDAMPDPKIVLTALTPTGAVIVSNDDWSTPVQPLVTTDRVKQLSIGVQNIGFPLGIASKDAAILANLSPGGYTATVSGVSAADVGTVLAEVYDTTPSSAPGAARLSNLSVLAYSSPDAPLLAGFVSSTSAIQLLFRAVGPGLIPFGVVGTIADPQIEVLNSQGTPVATNDNWDVVPAAGNLSRQASLRVGAFPLTAGSKDAAIALLGIGGLSTSYTLRGSGINGTSGMMLLEIYEVPN